jgi:hypothetical protein
VLLPVTMPLTTDHSQQIRIAVPPRTFLQLIGSGSSSSVRVVMR